MAFGTGESVLFMKVSLIVHKNELLVDAKDLVMLMEFSLKNR